MSSLKDFSTRYYNGAAAIDSKDGGGVGYRNGGVGGGVAGNGGGIVPWVMGRLPAPLAARINMAVMKGTFSHPA